MKTLDDKGLLAYFTQHRVAANLIMIMVIILLIKPTGLFAAGK